MQSMAWCLQNFEFTAKSSEGTDKHEDFEVGFVYASVFDSLSESKEKERGKRNE